MIDLGPRAPRLYHPVVSSMGKRRLYEDLDGGACKRRRTAPAHPGKRLVDLQILGEDGALVQEATIEEIWAPAHATRLEIVVVDENWNGTLDGSLDGVLDGALSAPETTFINLDDLGPLGGTSTLHNAILRESQLQAAGIASTPPTASTATAATTRSPARSPGPNVAPLKAAEPAADSDFGNLDWLINFKVDSVFEPKSKRGAGPKASAGSAASAASAKETAGVPGAAGGPGLTTVERSDQLHDGGLVLCSPTASAPSPASTASSGTSSSTSPSSVLTVSVAAKVGAATAATAATPSPQANRYSGPGKPPFTYTELIELALKDKGKLTVKEIYQWITKHFPFYQATDERWKNSVRHNLSINPHFRKESKAPQGAGHLWVVMDNNNKAKNSWKEERIQNFLASQISAAEVVEAAASVTPQKDDKNLDMTSPPSPGRPVTPPSPVTTGAKSQSQLNTWWSERISLERSAEEILSGVKREVGVEFLTPMDLDGDLYGDDIKLEVKDDKGFLYSDLTAEQVIAESGLQDELAGLYLLNDMTASITSDSLFPDDLNFGGLELPLSG